MKKIVIFIIIIISLSTNVWGQFLPPVVPPSYKDLIENYTSQGSYFPVISNTIVPLLSENIQMTNLYNEAISTFTPLQLLNIMLDVRKILEYTTNESVILLLGATYAYIEAANAQEAVTAKAVERLKGRFAFMAGSGDNYGLIIPLHFPLLSFGVSAYIDVPQDADKIKQNMSTTEYYDFAAILHGIDAVPLPYVQIFGQVNTWTLPFSLGFRAGMLTGFKELYKLFVTDVNIESLGFHFGFELKTLIFRTEFFFSDFRLNANYDSGFLNLGINRDLYIPITVGYNGGTETGVVFNGNAESKISWRTCVLTPKIVFGIKPKDKIPGIQYIGFYFGFGIDLVWADMKFDMNLNSLNAYANIEGHSKVLDNFQIPSSSSSGKYFLYDYRISVSFDIFYQSFTFEYAFFSKRYSILFSPFVFRW